MTMDPCRHRQVQRGGMTQYDRCVQVFHPRKGVRVESAAFARLAVVGVPMLDREKLYCPCVWRKTE